MVISKPLTVTMERPHGSLMNFVTLLSSDVKKNCAVVREFFKINSVGKRTTHDH